MILEGKEAGKKRRLCGAAPPVEVVAATAKGLGKKKAVHLQRLGADGERQTLMGLHSWSAARTLTTAMMTTTRRQGARF